MNNIFKVKLSIHPLFILILMLAVLTGYFIEILLLFLFVFVHECGHMFMANHLGWKVKEIKLLPFGGVLIVDDAHAVSAKEEILVALAGPLQNIMIIVVAIVCGYLNLLSYDWVQYLVIANGWLTLFNMLPISPLDGGKVVLSLLSLSLSYYDALKIVVWLSIVSSIAMILFGLTYSFWLDDSGPQLNLILIGIFLCADNIMKIRNLPFLLYRFILQRQNMIERLQIDAHNEQPISIFIHDKDTIFSLFKKVKRESSHVFYYVSSHMNGMKMKSEVELLKNLREKAHLNRALIDIID